MKALFTLLLSLFAIVALALSMEEGTATRMLNGTIHANGTLSINTTNYGYEEDLRYLQDNKLIYQSASWIGGKKYRRDSYGHLLYWLSYPPSAQNSMMVTAQHPDWNPNLIAVQDTLTSVGYDGHSDLYELLPAYNPLLASNPAVTELYNTFNAQDIVLQSIMGSPAPIPFDPFYSTNFCYSIPQPGTFNTPGFITNSAFFYDYCPFGTDVDRDLGYSSSGSVHYPLGLAIHQESYSWNLQNYDRMLITKNTLYNTNVLDVIQDLSISQFVDADVGPEAFGLQIAIDDVSGYVKGDGYEFAYSRDSDFDGGLSPKYIASKLFIPDFFRIHNAWFWRIGQGPNDYNPYNLTPSNRTANEKYWLATGRNPNTSEFVPIRPESDDLMEYELPSPSDTRFLNAIYGAQPGDVNYEISDVNGNYIYRLALQPHEALTYYSVLFVGDSLDDLKAKSFAIEAFLNSGMQIEVNPQLTCIPYLTPIQKGPADTFNLYWYSYTNPDHFEVAWKPYGAPASEWNITNLAGTIRSFSIGAMDANTWYEIKVGSVFFTPDEVYLESEAQLVNLAYTDADDPIATPSPKVKNSPNPFRGSTNIEFELKQAADIQLEIFNTKGQRVRSYQAEGVATGVQSWNWDAKDQGGARCASGIYYLRLKAGKEISHRKMLLVK